MTKLVKARRKRRLAQIMRKIAPSGGKSTLAKYGPEHFSKISKMRKVFGGGRPKKNKLQSAA